MRFALLLAAVLFAAPACAASGWPAPVCLAPAGAPVPGSHVLVVRRGWHIDVGFPADELKAPLRFVASALPTARYVLFGFGDMHYLVSRKKGVSTLAAALWPGSGIMLVTGLEGTPQQGFGAQQVIELTLSDACAGALQDFIARSFVTRDGGADVYETGPYEGSVYYLAVPRYSALHTCNTWAAEALRAAPLRVHHWGVLFAGQLWTQARRLQGDQLRGGQGSAPLAQPGRD
jgi:uncharacterized protein (TIGR02117 family)